VYGLRSNVKLWGFVSGRYNGKNGDHGGDVLAIPGSCKSDELLTAECSWNYGAN
jgi:hypothetical protein